MMENIEFRNIDKSNWQIHRFDEIASSISEKVNPTNTDLEIYVGLEHIDPESIHIKRYGQQGDVKGAKLRCYPGDVIFGRRRAYQRKAAIVDFDGFCSAHSLVLRGNPEIIDPKLFPFFMHSDLFMHRAVDISVGSLSPTINWKTLKEEEFLVPPKYQQAKIAELLWAMDDMVEKEKNNLNKYVDFYKVFLFDSVSGKRSKNFANWKTYTFGDLGESFGGLSGKTKKDFGSGKPFINYMNIFTNSKIDIRQVDYVELNENENQNEIKYGDIFFTGSSETPEEVGMSSVLLDDVKDYYLNSFCFGFRLYDFERLLPEFSRFLLRGYDVRKFMFKHAQGSTRFNLSKTTVKNKLRIKIPSKSEHPNNPIRKNSYKYWENFQRF